MAHTCRGMPTESPTAKKARNGLDFAVVWWGLQASLRFIFGVVYFCLYSPGRSLSTLRVCGANRSIAEQIQHAASEVNQHKKLNTQYEQY